MSFLDVVWVTGAKGFIGSHLAQALDASGMRVVTFDRAAGTCRRSGAADWSFPLSVAGLAGALDSHGVPQRVYHLAGGPTVGASFNNPSADFQSNVVTTELILDALCGRKVPLVFASSAAVYGEGHFDSIDADTDATPSSPYGIHKLLAEQLARSHARFFDLPVTILRLFSIYGPGLRKQLLFDVCGRLSASKSHAPLLLNGTGGERRDWLEVTDVVSAMQSLEDPEPAEVRVYNLASGRSSEIREVATHLVNAWGEKREVIFDGVSRPGDPFSLVADSSSIPPGFSPQIALCDGISHFVSWFRSEASTEATGRTAERQW